MKNILFTGLALFFFSGCALLGPTVTFTTRGEAVIDPASDTLDLAVSQPMMAYISKAECGDQDPIEILPIVTEDMESTTAHNLSLSVLEGQEPGTLCTVTVSVYNQSTTTNFSKSIDLYVLAEPAAEEAVVEEAAPLEEEPELKTELETTPVEDSKQITLTEEECLAQGGQYVSKREVECASDTESGFCQSILKTVCEFKTE